MLLNLTKLKKVTVMKYKKVIAGLVGCILSATASASLVFQSNIVATGQGFGAAPRNLTIQQTGNSTGPAGTESGCVGVGAGGGITFNTCVTDTGLPGGLVFDGNGITNQSKEDLA